MSLIHESQENHTNQLREQSTLVAESVNAHLEDLKEAFHNQHPNTSSPSSSPPRKRLQQKKGKSAKQEECLQELRDLVDEPVVEQQDDMQVVDAQEGSRELSGTVRSELLLRSDLAFQNATLTPVELRFDRRLSVALSSPALVVAAGQRV